MSIKKRLTLILSILFVAVVAGNPFMDAPPLSSAIPAAYASQSPEAVADPNLIVISPRNVNYTTEEVFIGSLERNAGFDARLNYPNTISVVIPRDGMFVSMAVSANDWVEEGAPLAVFSVVANDLEIDEAALALELAESSQRRRSDDLEAALDEARARFAAIAAEYEINVNAGENDSAGINNLRRAELAALAAEENYQYDLYSGERDLNNMRDRLAGLKEQSEDFTVYAPISGFVYDLVYFSVGRSVPRGQFICRISNPDVFQIVITAPNLSQLRLGAPVSIETSRRDAPAFPGHVIGNTTLLGRNESDNRAVVAFDDPQAFLDFGEGSILRLTGLRYRIQIQQADIQNVLLVPRRAVNTESSYRFVNILEDGLSKKRYVLIGLTNVEYAQVLDGLKAGDVVIIG